MFSLSIGAVYVGGGTRVYRTAKQRETSIDAGRARPHFQDDGLWIVNNLLENYSNSIGKYAIAYGKNQPFNDDWHFLPRGFRTKIYYNLQRLELGLIIG